MNTAVKVYNSIITSGKVTRGSIGIEFVSEVKPDLMKAFGLDYGIPVSRVIKGGPADKAGMKVDDIILSIEGTKMKSGIDLINRVSELPLGSKAKIEVDRQGKRLTLDVAIGDRQEVLAERAGMSRNEPKTEVLPSAPTNVRFGVGIVNLTDSEVEQMAIPDFKGGVRITRVEPDSFAAEIGVVERDILVSINRKPVTSVDDVKRLQGTLKPGDAVAFRVMRATPSGMPGMRPNQRGQAVQWQGIWLSGTLPKE
jgi:serine protease Do